MPTFTTLQIALGALSLTAFTLGIVEVRLEKDMHKNFWPYDGWAYCWPDMSDGPNMGCLGPYFDVMPAGLLKSVNNAYMACGALAIVTGLFGTAYVLAQLMNLSRVAVQRLIVIPLVWTTASTAVVFAVFIAATVKTYTSPTWHFTDEQSHGMHFTVEAWTCQMQHVFPAHDALDFVHATCTRTRIERWLLTPNFACLFALAALAAAETRRQISAFKLGAKADNIQLEEQSAGSPSK